MGDFCDRCELPRTPSDQILRETDEPAACCPSLSAWELWLVGKAKEDRLNMQKEAKKASNCLIVQTIVLAPSLKQLFGSLSLLLVYFSMFLRKVYLKKEKNKRK